MTEIRGDIVSGDDDMGLWIESFAYGKYTQRYGAHFIASLTDQARSYQPYLHSNRGGSIADLLL